MLVAQIVSSLIVAGGLVAFAAGTIAAPKPTPPADVPEATVPKAKAKAPVAKAKAVAPKAKAAKAKAPAVKTKTAAVKPAEPKAKPAAAKTQPAKQATPAPRPRPNAVVATHPAAPAKTKPAPKLASAHAKPAILTAPMPRPAPGRAQAAPPRAVMASAMPMVPMELAPAAAPAALVVEPAMDGPAPRSAPASRVRAEDLPAIKRGLLLARQGKVAEATAIAQTISDPVGGRLIEWALLRSPETIAPFERYAAFVRNHPSWPSTGLVRRRAEGALWDFSRDPAQVRAYFAGQQPTSAKGRLALARALLIQGDRANAAAQVREPWYREPLSPEGEQLIINTFSEVLTGADHRARLEQRLYDDDFAGGMRMANRLGSAYVALVNARKAVAAKASNAGALLDAVPNEARLPVYLFSRIQWLRRKDHIAEATQLMLAAPRDAAVLYDVDEWWVERRLIGRKLLDDGDARTAYRIVREAATPEKDTFRVDHEFTAGWIALRALKDPSAAYAHFARIPSLSNHPTSHARAYYWQGRALEALGRTQDARAQYQAASRFTVSYYGQIARAKIGATDMALRHLPELSSEQRATLRNLDIVRAVELLYAVNERELVATMCTDVVDRPIEVGALVLIGEIAAHNRDARALLHLGKTAVARNLPLDHFAFPTIGIPAFSDLGSPIDHSVVYAIARQESAFNPRAVSTAKALGLMQVTAGTGRVIARRHGVRFDANRLLNDPAYNAQFGAAELASLLRDYQGSYILSFAAYNAGRGRVRDWLAQYGDPRTNVDPLDWVERIPFTETRNYVQRVMENMQVYRLRLTGNPRLSIEADMRRGAGAATE